MKILVTGAAGFIGCHLALRLVSRGYRVEGLDAFTPFYDRALKEDNARALATAGVTIHRLDLASDDLRTCLHDANAVFHLAAQPGLSASASFDTYLRQNVTATHRLIEALRTSPALEMLVNISTSSVYGMHATGDESTEPRPTSYYGVTKLAAEQLVMAAEREQKLPACSFRLFSVYGPRERPDKLYPKLIRALLEDIPLPLFEGSEEHRRSYTFVDDIVDGLVAALDHWGGCRGQIINLGNDTSITTGEGIRIVEGILGKKVQLQRLPRRPGDQLSTQANIAKARSVLGYSPHVPPTTGLAATVTWYRDYLHRDTPRVRGNDTTGSLQT
jgi:UDP-glucuronate 4-epimerase